jgi:hypothetical protein
LKRSRSIHLGVTFLLLPQSETYMLKSFISIFKDDNYWNEKTIIGFMSFAVMVIIAGIDLVSALNGINLDIKDYIYQSFAYLTIGAFGIAGLEKFSPANKVYAESQHGHGYDSSDVDVDVNIGGQQQTCPECGTRCE